jgi:hypothetical protein
MIISMETQPFPSSIPEGTSSSQVQPVVSNQVPQTAQVTPVQQGLPSKRYRRVVFWHKLASGIFWFFAVLFFWNSIANFLL